MSTQKIYILLLACLIRSIPGFGQTGIEPEKAGRMEDGKFILTINPNWNKEQIARFASLFDIDSTIVHAIFNNQFELLNDSTDWEVKINQYDMPELSRTLGAHTATNVDKILFSALPEAARTLPPISLPANYGVNDFGNLNVFRYLNGRACFTLPGFEQAKQVYLSGSFNQWSTMQLPMHRISNGWFACFDMEPGKHHYKYIVDGRWMTDPNNKIRERDGHRGYNSVVFGYNYAFNLVGFSNARRVILAGSFNNWNTRELSMTKTSTGWELPLYLREGTHAYKFIVDGLWINDPDNPLIREDGRGNTNSFIAIGDTIFFKLNGFSDAKRVILSGSFNAWNTGELIMEKTADGWELPYVLAPGNYEYKYIVDGQWTPDPDNPYTTGSGNFTNSFFAYKPTHTFVLNGYDKNDQVVVSGSFNGWSREGYRMAFINGQWVFPIHLRPGRHSYKFIINGQWVMDPGNPLWEENEFRGDGNSVIWID